MTGIGEAAELRGGLSVNVTVRSVNHRFLDLAIRLKQPFRMLEPELRAAVGTEIRRGRVELTVDIETASTTAGLEVSDEVAESLQKAARRWRRRGLVRSELTAGELLAAPRVVRPEPEADRLSAEERDFVVDISRRALAGLAAERRREGAVLAAALGAHLDGLERCAATLTSRRQSVIASTAGDLEARVGELLKTRGLLSEAGGGLDPARVVQEVALLVERSDIAEELDRLQGHLEGFRSAMEGEGAIGRRLDFLTQEILRELNTIGSKSRDLEMQREVVEGKVLCEQLREQVQNVE